MIAVFLLTPIVLKLTREHFKEKQPDNEQRMRCRSWEQHRILPV